MKNKNTVVVVPIDNDNDSNNNFTPILSGGPNLNCDPIASLQNEDGCAKNDCASDRWKDGCLACICYYKGNNSWCDGTESAYYDNYFEENGENPFGECTCKHNWECRKGLACLSDWKSQSRCFLSEIEGHDFNCDPMKGSSYDGCRDKDCASDRWKDGCLACMCFYDNDSWCDGTQSAYYDNYYEEHGENPFGDSNWSNRKYNTDFSLKGTSYKWNWECEDKPLGCSPNNDYSDKVCVSNSYNQVRN